MFRQITRAVACLLCLCSCAPPPLPVPVQPGYEHAMPRSPQYSSFGSMVQAPPDQVFWALNDVYAELGLRPNMFNLQERVVGNSAARMHRSFADRPLRRFFSCGASAAGDAVNSAVLTVDVRSQAQEFGQRGSRVITWVRAGPGADWTPCASTGALEGIVIERVRLRLQS